jgi:hypothetical protein
MIIKFVTPEKMLCVALTLTAMLRIAPGQDPRFPWDRAHSAPAKPCWIPWLVLAALAIASSFYGVTCPDQFATASGQGMLDPGLLVAAHGQP